MNRSALNMQQKSDSVKLTSIVGKSPDPKGTNNSVYKNSHGSQSLTKNGPQNAVPVGQKNPYLSNAIVGFTANSITRGNNN